MFPPGPVHILRNLLSEHVTPGDTVIDATAGNGYDTLLLAELVGPTGSVIAIDLLRQAIDSTRLRLESEGGFPQVSLHNICHSQLADLALPGSVSAIIFNLGYLPGAGRDSATTPGKTLSALIAARSLLKPGGMLAAVCYTGHTGGPEEASAVESFFQNLPGHHTARYGIVNPKIPAPFLLITARAMKSSLAAPAITR